MEKESARENEVKKHQTEGGIQLLDEIFTVDLGRFGEGPHTNDVLDGTYTPPITATKATVDFLQECKRPSNYAPTLDLPPIIDRYNSIEHSWKLRKEKNYTYNYHMGHYTAVMKHDFLSWFFFQREEIPSISGYSPVCHRKCINLMILKKTDEL